MLVVVSGLASLFRALLILLASFECRRFYGDHLHDDDDDFDDLHDDDFGHELFLGCYSDDDDDDALHSELPLPFAQKRFYSVQSNKRNNDDNDDNNDDNDIRRYTFSRCIFSSRLTSSAFLLSSSDIVGPLLLLL